MRRIVLASTVGGVGMTAAVEAALDGRPALDIVEAGIRPVEADPTVRSVGLGGRPDLTGEVALDASLMDGHDLRCGAVGALSGYLHPISVARQVLEQLPHVLLVGDGAARFAAECGAETAELMTPEWRAEHEAWIESHVPPSPRDQWPDVDLAPWARLSADPETAGGTVTFTAIDAEARLAVGVSTCGWARKYPGRLGDSPIPPAGAYADDRYGAASCTGQGELAIRAGTARAVVAGLRSGWDPETACRAALDDLRDLRRDYGGSMTVHVVTPDGRHSVRSIGLERPSSFWLWDERDGAIRELPVEGESW
ncbi:MAG: isoaspartyl peptidase/L-asparaginase [Anaerolineae bacterium]